MSQFTMSSSNMGSGDDGSDFEEVHLTSSDHGTSTGDDEVGDIDHFLENEATASTPGESRSSPINIDDGEEADYESDIDEQLEASAFASSWMQTGGHGPERGGRFRERVRLGRPSDDCGLEPNDSDNDSDATISHPHNGVPLNNGGASAPPPGGGGGGSPGPPSDDGSSSDSDDSSSSDSADYASSADNNEPPNEALDQLPPNFNDRHAHWPTAECGDLCMPRYQDLRNNYVLQSNRIQNLETKLKHVQKRVKNLRESRRRHLRTIAELKERVKALTPKPKHHKAV